MFLTISMVALSAACCAWMIRQAFQPALLVRGNALSMVTRPGRPVMPTPSTAKTNNLGVLRLIFAALVIVSHTPELMDGNRSREILTRLFGSLSFGEVAVDGFFLVSGYLVIKSAIRNDAGSFVANRVFRIFPAYLATFMICSVALAPAVGGQLTPWISQGLVGHLSDMLLLAQPVVPDTFRGLHYPDLDGAIWTLTFEFRCYLLALLLVRLGAFRGKMAIVSLLGALFIRLTVSHWPDPITRHLVPLVVDCRVFARLFLAFAVGGTFYSLRERFPLRGDWAAVSALLACLSLYLPRFAEVGFILFAGYSVFWFAFAAKPLGIAPVVNRTDISYGLYLYAWPIENTLIWRGYSHDPLVLGLTTLLLSIAAGYLSWTFVERPSMQCKDALTRMISARKARSDAYVFGATASAGAS